MVGGDETPPDLTLDVKTFFIPIGSDQEGSVTKKQFHEWFQLIFYDTYIDDEHFDANVLECFDKLQRTDGLFYFKYSTLETALNKHSSDEKCRIFSDYNDFLGFLVDNATHTRDEQEKQRFVIGFVFSLCLKMLANPQS